MPNLILVIGNKRVSSWSLRPWLALRVAGITFEERLVALRQPDSSANIRRYSPSGKVPVLIDGDLTIWDSLAICEYAAELACAFPLWPENRGARAVARSVSAEMHSAFMPLRQTMSMDVARTIELTEVPAEVAADIARIQAIWADCRKRYGAGGPFLFGRFSIADAMFAPVATRFVTYGVALTDDSRAYVDALFSLPAMQEWLAAGREETLITG
jgi:glutathione S-transferase